MQPAEVSFLEGVSLGQDSSLKRNNTKGTLHHQRNFVQIVVTLLQVAQGNAIKPNWFPDIVRGSSRNQNYSPSPCQVRKFQKGTDLYLIATFQILNFAIIAIKT